MINVQPFIDKLDDTFRVLCWKVDSQWQTGVPPNTCVGITEEKVCRIWNIDTLIHYGTAETHLKTHETLTHKA